MRYLAEAATFHRIVSEFRTPLTEFRPLEQQNDWKSHLIEKKMIIADCRFRISLVTNRGRHNLL
jgi:hypothetical protein